MKNKNNYGIYFIALLILLVIVVLHFFYDISQGKYENRVIKKIYYADHIFPVNRELIDDFNKLYKDKIEVVPVNLPSYTTNDRKEVLSRYLRSKDIIDVFAVDQIWIKRFSKWAAPLESYFGLNITDKILPIALTPCYNKGKLLAIPFNIDIIMMYYRDDILRKLTNYDDIKKKLEEGITWEDFIELGKTKLFEKHPFYIFQADDYEGLVISFIELLEQQDDKFSSEVKLNLSTLKAKKALNLLIDIINKYKISPKAVLTLRENRSKSFYLNNNGVFLRGWPGFIKDFNSYDAYSKLKGKIRIAAIPHFKGGKPIAMLGGWSLMISKYSENKKEAAEFIKFLIEKKSQMLIYKERNQLSVLKEIYSDKKFLELKYYYKLLSNGVYRPITEDYTKISDILSYYTYLALKKEITAEEALKFALQKIKLGQIVIR